MSVAARRMSVRPGHRYGALALAAGAALAAYGVSLMDWEVVWDSRVFLLKGLGVSWLLALISIGLGVPFGILLAALRMGGPVGVRHAAAAFIEIVRATPQLMLIFWIFFTYPALTGAASASPWLAAIISLGGISACYLAEVVRSGLGSVPAVQSESAYSSGLSRQQTFFFVVLPQALRSMFPAFISLFVMIFKMTSFVYVIGIVDLFRATVLINNREYAPYTLYIVMSAIYVISCFALTSAARIADRGSAVRI